VGTAYICPTAKDAMFVALNTGEDNQACSVSSEDLLSVQTIMPGPGSS
jgi:hypothetical protein